MYHFVIGLGVSYFFWLFKKKKTQPKNQPTKKNPNQTKTKQIERFKK